MATAAVEVCNHVPRVPKVNKVAPKSQKVDKGSSTLRACALQGAGCGESVGATAAAAIHS